MFTVFCYALEQWNYAPFSCSFCVASRRYGIIIVWLPLSVLCWYCLVNWTPVIRMPICNIMLLLILWKCMEWLKYQLSLVFFIRCSFSMCTFWSQSLPRSSSMNTLPVLMQSPLWLFMFCHMNPNSGHYNCWNINLLHAWLLYKYTCWGIHGPTPPCKSIMHQLQYVYMHWSAWFMHKFNFEFSH
jgi:hypothetical protein